MDTKKGLSTVSGHEEKIREGSSTPNTETLAVVDQRKTKETDGGSKGMRVTTGKGTEGVA